MPQAAKNLTGSSPAGSSFADLASSIIAAIETGFQAAGTQAASGSVAGATAGVSAPAPASSIVEPPGGPGAPSGGPAPAHTPAHGAGQPEEEEGLFSRFKNLGKDEYGLPFGIGYGAEVLSKGYAQEIETQYSGKYFTPEELTADRAKKLPGFGGVAGTIFGGLIGGEAGAVAGSFIGQAGGEVASAFIGAKSERDEATREASERLAASLGQAESAVHSFRAQIEATGAPVQQVGQALGILQGVGPGVGSQAIQGAGVMALAEGTDFIKNTQIMGNFLGSNPALYELQQDFAAKGTHLAPETYRDTATLALLQGDMGAYNAAQAGREASEVAKDPKSIELAKQDAENKWSWRRQVEHWVTEGAAHLGVDMSGSDAIDVAEKALEERKKEVAGGAEDTGADDVNKRLARGKAKFSALLAESSAGNLIDQYRYEANGTATPEELAKRLPAIRAALQQNADADQTMIDQDQAELSGLKADSPLRPAYQLEISHLQDDQVQKRDIKYRELVHSNYLDQIKSTDAQSSLAQARSQIEGRSAADIQQQVESQSEYLIGMVRAPGNPLSPEEAAGIEESAIKQRYSAKIAVQRQSLDVRDERIEQAGLGVTQAQVSGGPEDVSQARGREVEAFQAKISELSQELQRGGLSVDDRIQKERELTATRESAAKAAFAQDQGRFNDNFALTSTLTDTAEVGLSRRIARGGNAGSAGSALSLSLDTITEAQNHLDFDRLNYGGNRQLIATDEGRVAQAGEAREQLLDQTNAYHPAGSVTRKMTTDAANFQIALEAPYLDGSPDANPLTRGNAVLADVRQDMGGLNKNRANLIKSGLWRDEDETKYTDQVNNDRLEMAQIEGQQRRGFLSMLPEIIAGSPGQGILSGVLPNAAQSAFYSGNAFVSGTFGQASRSQTVDDSGHTSQAGGAAGAFLSSTSAAGSLAALTTEMRRLNDTLQRGGLGGRSPMLAGQTNPALGFNALRGPGQ